jgi:hypothetical protein
MKTNRPNNPMPIVGQNDETTRPDLVGQINFGPLPVVASQRESFTPLHRSILTSSRWTNGDSAGKLVLVILLALKERNGFVAASVPGIAHLAGVTVEAARKVIEELKSPDPDSRSKQNEGRTIEEVEGGFRFLNNEAYLIRARTRPSRDERERDYVIQYNRSTSQPQTTYEKPVNPPGKYPSQPTSKHPSKETLDNWHPSELATFSALQGDGERVTFIIARGFAELAARKEENSFALAINYIAKKRNITKQRAGELRAILIRKGIIEETQPYSREENKAARYRWALPTTLPLVPESDDDEPLF